MTNKFNLIYEQHSERYKPTQYQVQLGQQYFTEKEKSPINTKITTPKKSPSQDSLLQKPL